MAGMVTDENQWRTPSFRQSVVAKIDEAVQRSGMPTIKNSIEMENHVFQKAKTKEEYLAFVARLILHVREMKSKNAGMAGQGQNGGQMMQDPINALQTLARQGSGNNQMMGMGMGGPSGDMGGMVRQPAPQNTASTLLQTLNQRPPGGQMMGMQGMSGPGKLGMALNGNQQGPMGINTAPQGPMGMNPGQQGQMGINPGQQGQMGMNPGQQSQIGLNPGQQGQMGLNPGQQGQIGLNPGQQGQMGLNPGQQGQMVMNSGQGQMGMNSGQQGQMGMNPSQQGPMGINPGQQGIGMNSGQQGSMGMNPGPQGSMGMNPGQGGPMGMNPGQQVQMGLNPGQQIGPMGMNPGQGGPMGMSSGQGGPMGMNPGQGGPMGLNPGQGGPMGMNPGQGGPMGMNPGQQSGPMGMNPGQQGGPMGMSPGQGGPMGPMGGQQMQGMNINQLGMAMGMNHMQRKPGEMMMSGQGGFLGPRGQAPPNQFLRQSPSPSAQSPAGMSPAMAPSPSGPQHPSGLGPIGGPGGPRSNGLSGIVMSPGSALNTPQQGGGTASPGNIVEEQQYRDKVRQLSKYIEPLRRMIARMGNDDVEKLSKMKKLLEILSNPNKRMPLETLRKCEVVLEKMDLKRGESGSVGPYPTTTASKELGHLNPLLEAVSNCLQSSVHNHTLRRTFGPTLETIFGPDMRMESGRGELGTSASYDEPKCDVPEILQREIARLDHRFKVSLDGTHLPGSAAVRLICWLDDKYLPAVPPVCVSVPADYPLHPPRCSIPQHEYSGTEFLSAVHRSLCLRVRKLPSKFSLSQLLDAWEMSVRLACEPPRQVTTVPAPAAVAVP